MSEPARNLDSIHITEDLRPRHIASVSVDASDYELASFGSRVTALFIDGMLMGVYQKIAVLALTKFVHLSVGSGLSKLMIVLPQLFYFILMEYNDGQTIGKKVMKIRVVSDASPGVLGILQISGRETIGRFLSVVSLCWGYVGAFSRPDKKTWHDRLFSTHVIKVK